jgi:hypothetical protein
LITPRLWFARGTTGAGSEVRGHSLACVVTNFATEGSCIYERLSADGTHIEAFENGTWRITASDEGPSSLSIEWPDNGEVDEDACGALMADLVAQGMAEARS